jgi:hypothetical protein
MVDEQAVPASSRPGSGNLPPSGFRDENLPLDADVEAVVCRPYFFVSAGFVDDLSLAVPDELLWSEA